MKEEIKLNDLKPEHYLVLAVEAVFDLDWHVDTITETSLIAYTKLSIVSWGEMFSLNINNDTAIINSSCIKWQFYDFGKNKRNITKFLARHREVKKKLKKEEIEAIWKDLKKEIASVK